MFRTAELGRKVSLSEYNKREPLLRQELLDAQQELRKAAKFPVIVLFGGVNGAGKREAVNVLNEWMDPRWLSTQAYAEPSDEERERPYYWRFWRDLSPRGQIGLFLSAWYSKPLLDVVYERIKLPEFDECLDQIIAFENALADDGALILKFWMHMSRAEQKKRMRGLEKDTLQSWRVKEEDWENWHRYDKFVEYGERCIMRASTGKAPIYIVEGMDHNYRSLTIGTTIRDAIRKRLDEVQLQDQFAQSLETDERQTKDAEAVPELQPLEVVIESDQVATKEDETGMVTVLSALDMSKSLGKKEYNKELRAQQARLNLLYRRAREKGVSTILVFEGPDAAGKGGAIRRVTASIDARDFRVIPIAAPTDEENAHHYLWRFWRHLTRAGRFTIYDRSWYGRVLVERMEGFATENEWGRAYAEINDFESQLFEFGTVLLKYWIHITQEEQLTRFKAREETPHKRWKLTDEDWRNRERSDDYELAANDMVERTSTRYAPWILVEGNDKRYARIKVLRTVCDKLEKALKGR